MGTDATYAFLFPNLAINRYGEWLDTNYVVPGGGEEQRIEEERKKEIRGEDGEERRRG